MAFWPLLWISAGWRGNSPEIQIWVGPTTGTGSHDMKIKWVFNLPMGYGSLDPFTSSRFFGRMVGSRGSIEHARDQKFVFSSSSSISAILMLASPIWIVFSLSITILIMLYLMKHRNVRRREPAERRCKLNKLDHVAFCSWITAETSRHLS